MKLFYSHENGEGRELGEIIEGICLRRGIEYHDGGITKPGTCDIALEIYNEISRCDCFIAYLNTIEKDSRYYNNPNVVMETQRAIDTLPNEAIILISDCLTKDIPFKIPFLLRHKTITSYPDEIKNSEDLEGLIEICLESFTKHKHWENTHHKCNFCMLNDISVDHIYNHNTKYISICNDCNIYLINRLCDAELNELPLELFIETYADSEYHTFDSDRVNNYKQCITKINEFEQPSQIFYLLKYFDKVGLKQYDMAIINHITEYLWYHFDNTNKITEIVLQEIFTNVINFITCTFDDTNMYQYNNFMMICLMVSQNRNSMYELINHIHEKFSQKMDMNYIEFLINKINSGKDTMSPYDDEFSYNNSFKKIKIFAPLNENKFNVIANKSSLISVSQAPATPAPPLTTVITFVTFVRLITFVTLAILGVILS